VLSPLVLGATEPAGAEDGKLAEAGRELPGDRQSDGEGYPLAEETGMPYQRAEGVVGGAGADAIHERAGHGIALPWGEGMDARGRWPDDVVHRPILCCRRAMCSCWM